MIGRFLCMAGIHKLCAVTERKLVIYSVRNPSERKVCCLELGMICERCGHSETRFQWKSRRAKKQYDLARTT